MGGAEEHVCIIGQQFGCLEYSVECSCGWVSGREYLFRDAAVEDWDNHCDVIFMEATTDA